MLNVAYHWLERLRFDLFMLNLETVADKILHLAVSVLCHDSYLGFPHLVNTSQVEHNVPADQLWGMIANRGQWTALVAQMFLDYAT